MVNADLRHAADKARADALQNYAEKPESGRICGEMKKSCVFTQ